MDIASDITFRKLTIFMTFMEKGNIARTAEALEISGVSVHRALHTLEESVRCPLFVHKGRNLLALPAAWTLLEYCQEVTQLMARGLEETRKTAGVGQGHDPAGTCISTLWIVLEDVLPDSQRGIPIFLVTQRAGDSDSPTRRNLKAILIALPDTDRLGIVICPGGNLQPVSNLIGRERRLLFLSL